MGRRRLTYAGLLARRFAQAIAGNSSETSHGEVGAARERTKNLITQFAPDILFNGSPDENVDVQAVLSEPNIIFPPEKVIILESGIKNTIDQVRTFTLPPSVDIRSGDEIGVITHAPHMMRFAHILNERKSNLPSGISLRALPIPSPVESWEYAEQEIRGLLKYAFITGDASEEPYPLVT